MSSANSTGFRTVDTFTISFIYNIKSNGPNIDLPLPIISYSPSYCDEQSPV